MLLSFDKTNLAGAKAAIFPVTVLSMGFVLFIIDKYFQHPWWPNKKWHLGNVNLLGFTFYKNTSCKNCSGRRTHSPVNDSLCSYVDV